MQNPSILQYVASPVQLVGLVLLVLAGVVLMLGGKRGDQKVRRWLILGLLGMGVLTTVGGIGLEVLRIKSNSVQPSGSTQKANAEGHGVAISAGGNVDYRSKK